MSSLLHACCMCESSWCRPGCMFIVFVSRAGALLLGMQIPVLSHVGVVFAA